ncbi:GNAT family N-acetyltransferase [uncultured Roseibium sp.]|uniref:GNAT family N-acetyltransferase n=1 Tax=uncultured Roseibium sp. TaxID=1936171 RepID=UPI00262C0F4B|nr:GNAT family N-acetyltransferase [uncultured Roseibium sp.]
MRLPELRTGRLLLRPVVPEDLPVITRLIGDYDVAKMLARVPHPYSLEDARYWYGLNAACKEDGERAFAIDAGGGLIGVISVGSPAEAPEFGYWLATDQWGQGFMTEAGRAILAWLFETTQTLRVMSGALKENTASINVLKKLGFQDEGPYLLPIRSRNAELPGARVMLRRERFLAAAGTGS